MLNFKAWLEFDTKEPSPTAAVILIREGRALILRRGPTAPWMPGVWNLPGGGIDPGERPVTAAVRECQEEAGITPTGVQFFKKYNDPEFTLYVFTGETDKPQPNLNYESDKFLWVSAEEIKKYRFVPYVAEAVSAALAQSQTTGARSDRA